MDTSDNDQRGYEQDIPNDLFERICASPGLRDSPDLQKLFRTLRTRALTELEIRQEKGRRPGVLASDVSVRQACQHLRGALRFYFLYTLEGIREKLQVAFPAADSALSEGKSLNPSGRFPRVYHLQTGPAVHTLKGAAAFWHPHFIVGKGQQRNRSAIVFTEPMMFRDTRNRFFIRHLDVNEAQDESDQERGSDFYISQLKRKMKWIIPGNMVLSRAYVPGGEVLAKDKIWEWLNRHAADTGKLPGMPDTPKDGLCKFAVSRDLRVSGDPSIYRHHRILLGSARANKMIREFQRRTTAWMPWKIEDEGIRIRCNARDIAGIKRRIHELLGDFADSGRAVENMVRRVSGGALLREDWRKISFALVSREVGLEADMMMTVICANQGRSIHELGENILTNDDRVSEIRTQFGITGWFPQAFQMLFAMRLVEEESRCSGWKALLYVPLHEAKKRPPGLTRLNWPKSRIAGE